MASSNPLSPVEEELWRSLMRIVKALPRCLHDDLVQSTGITASEYTTMMNLSEAPDRELRMTDLANATALSPSRTTRVVESLQSRGFVTKRVSSADARGNVARMTPKGMAKLRAAWPAHLESVRRRVMNQIEPSCKRDLARSLSAVAAGLED
jgi:DNA-binding MarR family transcriptional regulator